MNDEPSDQLSLLPQFPKKPRRKPCDPSWEALIRATEANPSSERIVLNVALKSIRDANLEEGLSETDLPTEIERRAAMWRKFFPSLMLTPMALAKHWHRIPAQLAANASTVTNQQRAFEQARRWAP